MKELKERLDCIGYGTIKNTIEALDKVVRKLVSTGGQPKFVYEAGPCGFVLHRHLKGNGFDCIVVAPSIRYHCFSGSGKDRNRLALLRKHTVVQHIVKSVCQELIQGIDVVGNCPIYTYRVTSPFICNPYNDCIFMDIQADVFYGMFLHDLPPWFWLWGEWSTLSF